MTTNEYLTIITIIAIIIAPIVAVQVQKYLEYFREKRQRKLDIFRTLMMTRGARLSSEHVNALNKIDIEFYKNKKIIEPWKLYLDHLNINPELNEKELEDWVKKGNELLVDLLYTMANELNYHFDKVSINKGIYLPRAHGEFEQEMYIIRKNLLKVLSGDQIIKVEIQNKN